MTILMPIYNGIEFLNESIDSIKSQTYRDWKLIIGINGHELNSKTYKIAQKYESNKIKVLDLGFIGGKAKSLNKMIEFVEDDWVAILDVDDKWLPQKLEKQLPLISSYDVVGTLCQYFQDRNNCPPIPTGDISNFNFNKVNPIINSSALIKKELCYWDTDIEGVEDYSLWKKLRKLQFKFYNIPEVLVMHRIHNDSAFNGTKEQSVNLKKIS